MIFQVFVKCIYIVLVKTTKMHVQYLFCSDFNILCDQMSNETLKGRHAAALSSDTAIKTLEHATVSPTEAFLTGFLLWLFLKGDHVTSMWEASGHYISQVFSYISLAGFNTEQRSLQVNSNDIHEELDFIQTINDLQNSTPRMCKRACVTCTTDLLWQDFGQLTYVIRTLCLSFLFERRRVLWLYVEYMWLFGRDSR